MTITNNSQHGKLVSAALSWEDMIGRRIRDIDPDQSLDTFHNDAWDANNGKMRWIIRDRVQTESIGIEHAGFKGIRQQTLSKVPLSFRKYTHQNYNNEFLILAEETGGSVTFLPSYEVDHGDRSWRHFRKKGSLPESSLPTQATPLFQGEKNAASAVCVQSSLAAGEAKTFRFSVAWFAPEVEPNPTTDHPNSYFEATDYNKFYHNYFSNLKELFAYAAENRQRILDESTAWHKPILDSTYPDWLKFKLINSGYTIYAGSILNKSGDFTIMEGGMGGLAGTMDQRLSSHPFYHKMFTELDRSELDLFGYSQEPEGNILHFDGHYYVGLADKKTGRSPTPNNWMLDNTGSWLVQMAKDYMTTGERNRIEKFQDIIIKAEAFLKKQIKGKIQIPSGPTTYDDFWHPEIYSYTAGTYIPFLRAGETMMRAIGNDTLADQYAHQAELTATDTIRYLWTGSQFAYGCGLDGKTNWKLNDPEAIEKNTSVFDSDGYVDTSTIVFGGQLAGQMINRLCGWGDIIPIEMASASALTQLKYPAWEHRDMDYRIPKVWHRDLSRALKDRHDRDSTSWSFYEESYLAMAAIQAGHVEDGLTLMKGIQMQHLRNGYAWSQNLWNIGDLAYMSSPVTWFITDILAGASLDVPKQTLFLAPVMREGEDRIKLPLFYPRFWAMVDCDRTNKTLF